MALRAPPLHAVTFRCYGSKIQSECNGELLIKSPLSYIPNGNRIGLFFAYRSGQTEHKPNAVKSLCCNGFITSITAGLARFLLVNGPAAAVAYFLLSFCVVSHLLNGELSMPFDLVHTLLERTNPLISRCYNINHGMFCTWRVRGLCTIRLIECQRI